MKQGFISKLKEYYHISKTDDVLRRYVILNSFDGALTVLAILLGAYFLEINSSKVIVTAAISAAIALCVSGIWGAYFTEWAERRKKVHELERQVLHKLENTDIGKAEKFATLLISIVNGLTPLLIALVILLPFFLGANIKDAVSISIGLGFAALFLIGAFLGAISKEDMYMTGFKIVLAGAACAVILFLVGKI